MSSRRGSPPSSVPYRQLGEASMTFKSYKECVFTRGESFNHHEQINAIPVEEQCLRRYIQVHFIEKYNAKLFKTYLYLYLVIQGEGFFSQASGVKSGNLDWIYSTCGQKCICKHKKNGTCRCTKIKRKWGAERGTSEAKSYKMIQCKSYVYM